MSADYLDAIKHGSNNIKLIKNFWIQKLNNFNFSFWIN